MIERRVSEDDVRWRREVLRRFDEGDRRFDRQDEILKSMQAWVALHAAGRIASNAILWAAKVGAWVAAIWGALHLGGGGK